MEVLVSVTYFLIFCIVKLSKIVIHDGLFWPILLLVDLAMSIIRKREQTET